jgi:hypothetical protein
METLYKEDELEPIELDNLPSKTDQDRPPMEVLKDEQLKPVQPPASTVLLSDEKIKALKAQADSQGRMRSILTGDNAVFFNAMEQGWDAALGTLPEITQQQLKTLKDPQKANQQHQSSRCRLW